VIGRRKPGISLQEAGSDLGAVAQRLAEQYPTTNQGKGVVVTDLREHLVGHSRSATWLLFASVGLFFLIVCANVANLLLARAEVRRGEMALRVALGATRARIVLQVLTECGVLFALGSAGGALLANFLVDIVADTLVDPRLATTLNIDLDALTLAISSGACLTCGLTFALVPALAASHLEPQAVLRESAAGSGASRARRNTQKTLVGAQVALAFVLLVAGGLTGQGLVRLLSTPLGLDPERLATATVMLPEARYPGGGPPDWAVAPSVTAFFRDAVARLAATPGVEAAAANGCLPIACSGWSVAVEGRPPAPPNEVGALGFHVITPDYFKVTKIPLLRGRTFSAADRADTRLVVVLSQAAAEHLFPGEDPIGRRIDSGVEERLVWREVVGVVGDVRSGGVTQPVGIDGYFPLEQLGVWNRSMTLLARSERAESLLREIPGLVQALDPQQDVTDVMTMEERVSSSLGKQRRLAVMLSVFALFAQVLAALGFFGLMSYATAQRTREFGIRLALGSTPNAIVLLVLKGGLGLLGVGLAAGSVGAILLGRSLAGKLPEVRAFDLTLFTLVPAVLTLVGLLGCLLPARRAARIAPARALRYD
jgi:putative ABC transport system permease protein